MPPAPPRRCACQADAGPGRAGGHSRSLNAFRVGGDELDGNGLVTASYEVDLSGRLAALRGRSKGLSLRRRSLEPRRAQSTSAAVRRDQAAFAYRKAALVASANVENAMAPRQPAAQQEAAARRQRTPLSIANRLAADCYRAGYAPHIGRLDAGRGPLSARLSVVALRADRLRAIIELHRSLGGDWSDRNQSSGGTP